MLHQVLPRIDSRPLTGWLMPAIVGAAGLSVALLALLMGLAVPAMVLAIAGLAGAGVIAMRRPARAEIEAPISLGPDYAALGTVIGLTGEPVALTTAEGSLLIANPAYRERFGPPRSPLDLASGAEGREALAMARELAWRDGAGCVAGAATDAGTCAVEVERIGAHEDLLLWRFPAPTSPDALTVAARRVEGDSGERLSANGVMAAVIDGGGVVLAANRAFIDRALPNSTLR